MRDQHTNIEEPLNDVVNKIAKHIPDGYIVSLCIENGSAWVELGETFSGNRPLPDSTDKNLIEQLNDALCIANGWNLTQD